MEDSNVEEAVKCGSGEGRCPDCLNVYCGCAEVLAKEVRSLRRQLCTAEKEAIEEDKREAAEVGKLRAKVEENDLWMEEHNCLDIAKGERRAGYPELKAERNKYKLLAENREKELYEQENGQALQVQSMAAQIRRISDQRESNLERAEKAEAKIKELEGRLGNSKVAFDMENALREERSKALDSSRKEAAMLREVLKGLVESATKEANEKGLGGFHGARLSDAREALSQSSSEWFDKKMKEAEARGWFQVLDYMKGLYLAADIPSKRMEALANLIQIEARRRRPKCD